ncbi:MAG: cell surface protein [Rhodopirellula sp.]|nr:cell surface protein [Rhodopirellula sp.]
MRSRQCDAVVLGMLWVVVLGELAFGGGAAAYLGPSDLAVSKDGKILYAALADARQVAWIDVGGGKLLRRIDVAGEPSGLALSPDGRRLVVACAAPRSTLVVLDAVSGSHVSAIPVGHTATSPVIGADGRRAYVCNRFNNDVSVIDLAEGKELARIPAVREPVAAALTPDGRTLLVANHLPNTPTDKTFRGNVSPVVTLIDTRTHATAAIPLTHGANGLRGVCVLPDGKHALVSHLLSNFEMIPFRVDMGWINVNVVSLIDLDQRKVIHTLGIDEQHIGAGNPWDVACSADGQRICVSVAGTHQVCVIDRRQLLDDSAGNMQPMMGVWPIYLSLGASAWRRIELTGRGPRAIAVAGSTAFVAQYFSDSVEVIDLASQGDASVGTIALGPPPELTLERRGELLFHDATICYQHWQSCASCHPDGRADGLNWDLMNDGTDNSKNTKSMLLAHETPPAMAERVRMTAEDAVRSGIAHILFSTRPEEEATAIDAYLKQLAPLPSPRLVDGCLSPAAERGRKLFESDRVGCALCHPEPLYTDGLAHNVGTRSPKEQTDRFDTPTLVEVWRTAPYLHDGRYTTIEQLLAEGGHGLGDTKLSARELADLVEFVLSL